MKLVKRQSAPIVLPSRLHGALYLLGQLMNSLLLYIG